MHSRVAHTHLEMNSILVFRVLVLRYSPVALIVRKTLGIGINRNNKKDQHTSNRLE